MPLDDRIYRVFGARVRELREEKSVTQEELARRVELSRTSITNIEQGRQRVMLHQAVEIARALDQDPVELMRAAEAVATPEPLRDDVARLVEQIERESDNQA